MNREDDIWQIKTNDYIHRDDSLENCLHYILHLFERTTNKNIKDTCFFSDHLDINHLIPILIKMNKPHLLEALHIYVRDMLLDSKIDYTIDIICLDEDDSDWKTFNK